MEDNIIISAKNLKFTVPVFKPAENKVLSGPREILSRFYTNRSTRVTKDLLDGVTFSLKSGQRLGILGRNGAGKTTLLRVLCKVYTHNGGELSISGSTQGLFDVQMGMDPNATGMENIYLRGLQMRMTLSQIRSSINGVIEFANLGESLQELFSTYSAGMKLRLASSIATMASADILIMDEWIGAGDKEFKERLNAKMDEVINKSKVLVIASHNEALLIDLCSHGLVMDSGQGVFFGEIKDAVKYYHQQGLK